jgi:hypothetical protein
MVSTTPVPEELTYSQRRALPAAYHQPHWDGLGVPHSWVCQVCWDDGETTAWPCEAANTGNAGLEVARAAGLSYSW